MKTITELKKGCGINLGWCDNKFLRNILCGEENEYCFSCQALLKQTEEIYYNFEHFVNNLREDFKKNQYLCFNSIMEEEIDNIINKFTKELKSAIIGEEKKEWMKKILKH